jgi:hypothetical protein
VAVFRKINISFWQDVFVLNLTPEEKFFYLYLMTNSKTQQCGIYELPRKIIEFETGYNGETVDKLLKRFMEYGKILYCDSTKEIMLLNWIKYNFSSSPKVLTMVKIELQSVKNKDFIEQYNNLCIEYGYSIYTGSQKEEEKEKEKEEEKEPKNPLKKTYLEFVHLTDEEHEKLLERLGEKNTKEMIERLNNYIGSKGKRYKSHYHTILNWCNKDGIGRKEDKPKIDPTVAKYLKMMEGRQ